MSVSTAPWDNQIFSFGYFPYNTTIPQCNSISFGWQDNFNAAPNSTGPYQLQVYSGLGQPLLVEMGFGNGQNWQAAIPQGDVYLFGMTDSRGLSGGTSMLVTIDRGSASCNTTSFVPNDLQYDLLTSTTSQCGTMIFQVKNGQPPYKLEILPENHFPKTMNFSTSILEYVIDLNSNTRFYAVLSDASGKVSTQGLLTVGPSNDASCLTAAATVTSGFPTAATYSIPPSATDGLVSSKRPVAAIVGGVVGGVVFCVLVGTILFLLRKSRSTSVRVLDDLDLSSPIENRSHFPEVMVRPSPWSAQPSEPGQMANVPIMGEARPKHASHLSVSSGHVPLLHPSPSYTAGDPPTATSSSFPTGESTEASGTSPTPSGKRARSSQPLTAISTAVTTASHANTLREEDVGVAVPPPPSYHESYPKSEG